MAEASSYLQYSFLVPVSATIVGWFVVARQTDRREFRKEVREQIKELRASIDEVRLRSTAYWVGIDDKEELGAAIALKAELKRMSRLAQAVSNAGIHFDVAERIAEVRKQATGGQFEVKSRVRVPSQDGDRVSDIVGALEDLLTAVDSAFYVKFAAPRASPVVRWLPLAGFLFVHD